MRKYIIRIFFTIIITISPLCLFAQNSLDASKKQGNWIIELGSNLNDKCKVLNGESKRLLEIYDPQIGFIPILANWNWSKEINILFGYKFSKKMVFTVGLDYFSDQKSKNSFLSDNLYDTGRFGLIRVDIDQRFKSKCTTKSVSVGSRYIFRPGKRIQPLAQINFNICKFKSITDLGYSISSLNFDRNTTTELYKTTFGITSIAGVNIFLRQKFWTHVKIGYHFEPVKGPSNVTDTSDWGVKEYNLESDFNLNYILINIGLGYSF